MHIIQQNNNRCPRDPSKHKIYFERNLPWTTQSQTWNVHAGSVQTQCRWHLTLQQRLNLIQECRGTVGFTASSFNTSGRCHADLLAAFWTHLERFLCPEDLDETVWGVLARGWGPAKPAEGVHVPDTAVGEAQEDGTFSERPMDCIPLRVASGTGMSSSSSSSRTISGAGGAANPLRRCDRALVGRDINLFSFSPVCKCNRGL